MESREKFACGKAMQKGQNERPRAGALAIVTRSSVCLIGY